MKKTILATAAVLGLSTAVMACGAHKGGYYGKHGGGMEMMKIIKQLDLTSEQKAQLKEMRKASKEARKAKREEMQAKRKAHQSERRTLVAQYMTAESFDKEGFKAAAKEKAASKQAKMKEMRDKRLENRADKIEKVFNILTPEQRVKWVELAKEEK